MSRGVWRTSLVDTRLIKRPARDIHGIIGRIHSIVVYSGIVERGKENQKPKGGGGKAGKRYFSSGHGASSTVITINSEHGTTCS